MHLVVEAPRLHDRIEGVPPMDETCRLAILEVLRFAELKAEVYHMVFVRLSRM